MSKKVKSSRKLLAQLGQSSSLVRQALQDRVVGVIIGSALGDAVGLYSEFLTAADVLRIYGGDARFTLHPTPSPPFYGDTHRGGHPEGNWTDDTDQALVLLLAFLHKAKTNDADPGGQIAKSLTLPLPAQQDVAQRLWLWCTYGTMALGTLPLGLGAHTREVVNQTNFRDNPTLAAQNVWAGASGMKPYWSAPNGALMRTHPLGVMTVFRSEEDAFRIGADISKVTHFDPRCVVSCVIGTALVRAVVRGEIVAEGDINALIDRAVAWYLANEPDARVRARFKRAELDKHVNPPGGLDGLKLDEPGHIGYTYKCLGAGIVCLRLVMRMARLSGGALVERETFFEQLIRELTMRGGDADTNACFAGALLGGYCGWTALPGHWKRGLTHGEWLRKKSENLCEVLGLKNGSYDGALDKQTNIYGGRARVYTAAEMSARWRTHAAQSQARIAQRTR